MLSCRWLEIVLLRRLEGRVSLAMLLHQCPHRPPAGEVIKTLDTYTSASSEISKDLLITAYSHSLIQHSANTKAVPLIVCCGKAPRSSARPQTAITVAFRPLEHHLWTRDRKGHTQYYRSTVP